jgi:hypothetical protein
MHVPDQRYLADSTETIRPYVATMCQRRNSMGYNGSRAIKHIHLPMFFRHVIEL